MFARLDSRRRSGYTGGDTVPCELESKRIARFPLTEIKPNLDALIIPGKSLGGIPLGTDLKDLLQIVYRNWFSSWRESCELINPMEIRYKILPGLSVSVDIVSNKVVKVIALDSYRGWLPVGNAKVRVGCIPRDLRKQIPSLYFDESVSLFLIPDSPGVCLEVADVDPYEADAWEMVIESITVTDLGLMEECNRRLNPSR